MTDLRQTKEYTKYMEGIGWEVLQLNKTAKLSSTTYKQFVYLRKLPLLGYVAKMQRPQIIPTLEDIKNFCKDYGVGAFYLEPSVANGKSQIANSLERARNSFAPAKTIHIDLGQPEEKTLSEMKPKTRYNIGLATRRGVKIVKSEDVNSFTKLYTQAARDRGMWLSQKGEIRALYQAFRDKCDLLLAYDSDQLVAGLLVVYSDEVGYYMYAGSTKSGNKVFAPTLLTWEAIVLAKKRKKKFFDFEGVYDPRYPSTKTWKGFTKFKEGFGGEAIEYPPTLVYYKNFFLRFLGV